MLDDERDAEQLACRLADSGVVAAGVGSSTSPRPASTDVDGASTPGDGSSTAATAAALHSRPRRSPTRPRLAALNAFQPSPSPPPCAPQPASAPDAGVAVGERPIGMVLGGQPADSRSAPARSWWHREASPTWSSSDGSRTPRRSRVCDFGEIEYASSGSESDEDQDSDDSQLSWIPDGVDEEGHDPAEDHDPAALRALSSLDLAVAAPVAEARRQAVLAAAGLERASRVPPSPDAGALAGRSGAFPKKNRNKIPQNWYQRAGAPTPATGQSDSSSDPFQPTSAPPHRMDAPRPKGSSGSAELPAPPGSAELPMPGIAQRPMSVIVTTQELQLVAGPGGQMHPVTPMTPGMPGPSEVAAPCTPSDLHEATARAQAAMPPRPGVGAGHGAAIPMTPAGPPPGGAPDPSIPLLLLPATVGIDRPSPGTPPGPPPGLPPATRPSSTGIVSSSSAAASAAAASSSLTCPLSKAAGSAPCEPSMSSSSSRPTSDRSRQKGKGPY